MENEQNQFDGNDFFKDPVQISSLFLNNVFAHEKQDDLFVNLIAKNQDMKQIDQNSFTNKQYFKQETHFFIVNTNDIGQEFENIIENSSSEIQQGNSIEVKQNKIYQRKHFQNIKNIQIKKGRKKPDYKKNICGYITKNILKQAVGQQYRESLCKICEMNEVQFSYFLKICNNVEHSNGPLYLYLFVTPNIHITNQSDLITQIRTKRIIRAFFLWFLRYRYMRYILKEGKMRDKDAYIKYKNKELLPLIRNQQETSEKQIVNLVARSRILKNSITVCKNQYLNQLNEIFQILNGKNIEKSSRKITKQQDPNIPQYLNVRAINSKNQKILNCSLMNQMEEQKLQQNYDTPLLEFQQF